MIACQRALTNVNYIDRLRQRFETTRQSADDDDSCAADDAMTSTVEARRWTTRARSLPLDGSETTTCRRLVSRGTQTSSALARYLTVAVAAANHIGHDEAWLRRIDAMDLSFPVSCQSELRGFLADTLAIAEHGAGDADGKQVAVSKPRTPQMRRRRWAACDLCLDDGPTATADTYDRPSTALDDDPEQWTDDDDDGEILSSGGGSDRVIRPVVARWTTGIAAETRPYFRTGYRTVSRLPAPNMPMIREDEQTSSADDDDQAAGDTPTPARRSPPSEPPPLLRSLQKSSAFDHRTQCSRSAAVANVELVNCCRRIVETPTKDDPQPAPPTSTSPSLLDMMHKKYCANQYARRPAPSTPGCHGNAHLLDVATPRRQAADCDCDTINDLAARQTDAAEVVVSGSHVTLPSHRRGDCDAASDATVGDNVDTHDDHDAAAQSSTTTPSIDVMSSTGFDDEEDEDDDEEEEEESGALQDEEQQNKTCTVCDDQPWKKRFCDCCHGELKVRHSFLNIN